MFNPGLIIKVINKLIPKERREKYLNTPFLYKITKILVINILLISTPFFAFFLVTMLKEMGDFSETIYWIILPFLFLLLPLMLLVCNLFFYVIPPFRDYLTKIHEKNNLSNFSDSNKGLIKGWLYFSPLILVILLGIFLSYQKYSEEIVGSFVILSTVIVGSLAILQMLKDR